MAEAIIRRIPKLAAPDGKKRPSRSETPLDPPVTGRRPSDASTERARLLAEQADRAARINRQEAGELVPAVEVAREWASICAGIRAGILAVPARLATTHPGNPALIAALERELREALVTLADDEL